jgi:SHAQKYF class myb-like DNA-binding protein
MKQIEHKRDGKWSPNEHDQFLTALQTYGRNWKEISKVLKTRDATQVRSHAQKFYLRNEKLKLKAQSSVIEGASALHRLSRDIGTQHGEGVYFAPPKYSC